MQAHYYYFWLILQAVRKTAENQLAADVFFRRLKQNWKKNDDDAVDKVMTVKITLCKYTSWWFGLCKIQLDYKRSQSVILGI